MCVSVLRLPTSLSKRPCLYSVHLLDSQKEMGLNKRLINRFGKNFCEHFFCFSVCWLVG